MRGLVDVFISKSIRKSEAVERNHQGMKKLIAGQYRSSGETTK